MENLSLGQVIVESTGQAPCVPIFKEGFPKLLISGDYNAFDEGWNGWGVYKVSGLYESKTYKLPIYIGSCWREKGLVMRIENDHILSLKRNGHDNDPLQHSWNKYGQENFVWWCLEVCPPDREICLAAEQKFFDYYRPFVDEFGGFNVAKFADAPAQGRPLSEEAKAKRRETIKTSEKYKRLVDSKKKTYFLKNINEELIEIFGLREFCKNNNIHRKLLSDVIEGERICYNGWHLPETVISREELEKEMNNKHVYLKKEYSIRNPEGEIIQFFGLTDFCKKHGFNRTSLNKLFSGKIKRYHGWSLPKTNLEEIGEDGFDLQRKKICLKSPNMEIITCCGINVFCKKYNLHRRYIRELLNGKRNCYKGWTRNE